MFERQLFLFTILICIVESKGYAQIPQGVTPIELQQLADIKDYAAFGDAEHRGPKWLDTSDQYSDSESDLKTDLMTESSSLETESESKSKSSSLGGSSVETNEEKHEKRVYRECTPCPHDMMKRHINRGISWICARYQRARRSFKSDCMMRYRNCQDGTLFVKLHDHRCANSTFHGKHWFYVYRV